MISVEDTYPGRSVPANASYPEGAIQNEVTPGVSDDGTPLDELWGNDFEGLKQAIARAAGIVPTPPGNVPDTATASQILQGLIEIVSGRAFNYDDSGVANAYVLDVQTNQQGPKSLFNHLHVEFIVGNDNTGASTIDVNGLGVITITGTGGGELRAGEKAVLEYNSTSGEFELLSSTVTKQKIAPANNASSFHLNKNGADGGLYIYQSSTGAIGFSRDAEFDGTNWIARATAAQIFFLTSGEGLALFSDSGLTVDATFTPTQVWALDSAGHPIVAIPSFRAYLSASQLNITGVEVIEFDTENWDTKGDYDNVTNYRYTPSVSGKYLLSTGVRVANMVDTDSVLLSILKNGSTSGGVEILELNVNGTFKTLQASTIVEANGTTDYFEIAFENQIRNTSDVNPGSDETWFEGHRISA